ncbi:MAG: alkaline phosphatase D family protein [Kangiellaceae bacterium]|nr:alkaline phosphatase D family protein [Kangiellaceae bacterium]
MIDNKMNRRRFLETVVVTVGAASVVGLSGCSGDGLNEPIQVGEVNSDPTMSMQYFPQSVASGDPTASSVVLWSRLVDASVGGDLPVIVQIATDESFNNLVSQFNWQAMAVSDGCVKVKFDGLSAYTTYYYRFIYQKDGESFSSPVGRTKTAPAAGDDVAVKFAYVSCQDYIGRFYNSYLKLLDEDDLDFVVHLGDYIYETTGDPQFQVQNGRSINFDDQAGAIELGSGDNVFYAAQSTDNYRQLYKTYRSDEVLQKVHERFPMIAIWDDHEFSDDSYGATATFFDGKQDETNESRKRNAEQAYFEFMPIDAGSSGSKVLNVDQSQLFPNTRIYRDFMFGKNVHLMMTDFRSQRPDHLIPEDAFPGTIAVDEPTIKLILGTQGIPFAAVSGSLMPYININDANFSAYIPVLIGVLTQGYMQAGLDAATAQAKATEKVNGNLAGPIVNDLISQYNASVPAAQQLPLIADAVLAAMPRGLAYALVGKTQLFGAVGSRYFVVKDTYDLLAGALYAFNSGSQDALGIAQELWLKDKVLGSPARWKVIGNSVSMNSLVLDLTNPLFGVPAPFNQKFYLNVDHWDGFGQKRDELLGTFAAVPGTILLSGDIHSSFVGDHGQGTIEFTSTSVSSGNLKQLIQGTLASDPVLSQIPGLGGLVDNANALLQSANPKLKYAETGMHGVAIVEANADTLTTTYYQLPADAMFVSMYADPAQALSLMTETSFTVDSAGLQSV